MIALLSILIFLAFSIFLISTSIRMTLQVKNFPQIEGNILFMTFLLSANAFLISSAMQAFDWFIEAPLQYVLQGSMGAITFCLLCFVIIASVKNINGKQLRTLLRLPLIGVLLGVYFKYQFILLGLGVIHTLMFIYLFRIRNIQLYVFRQYAKGFLGIIVFIIGTYYKIEVLPLVGFLFFLVMDVQILNAIKLKMSLENSKEEDEEINS